MCIAMAGMLAPCVKTLPPPAWEAIFGLLTAWFAWRLVGDTKVNSLRSLVSGHRAAHLFHCAAMVYMFPPRRRGLLGRLQYEQGRADHAHPSARDRVGQAQHQRQRHLSGLFPDEAVGPGWRKGPMRSRRSRRWAALAATTISRGRSCSSPLKRRATSAVRRLRSTVAVPP
jgi:Domain of unknown function (DUF5134)